MSKSTSAFARSRSRSAGSSESYTSSPPTLRRYASAAPRRPPLAMPSSMTARAPGSDGLGVRDAGLEGGLVQDHSTQHRGVAYGEVGDNASRSARTQHDRRRQVEPADERLGVVSLLVDGRRRPSRRPRAARVAASVVGDDRVLGRENCGDLRPVACVAGRPGNQQNRGPVPPSLVVERRTVDLDQAHCAHLDQRRPSSKC